MTTVHETPPPPDPPRSVRIVAGPGHAAITMDGQDIGKRVRGYSLSHDIQAALPVLVLQTTAPDGAEWEGLARVAVADPRPDGQAVAEFLAGIDPSELDRDAINRDDLDGSSNELTKAMLAQLIDYALGRG